MNATHKLTAPLLAPLLDRRLLAGADPGRDPTLELRGRRVCSRRRRDRLAADLERIATAADDSAVRTGLLGIARRLRSDAAVDPQGMLLVRHLPSASSVAAIRRANAALDPR